MIPSPPLTRTETYLAKIAGEDVEIPEPLTRKEQYLHAWASGTPVPPGPTPDPGVETTVTGVAPVIYPLAEAVEESATPQPLSTVEGDNIVSISAEVSSIEVGITYIKETEAT